MPQGQVDSTDVVEGGLFFDADLDAAFCFVQQQAPAALLRAVQQQLLAVLAALAFFAQQVRAIVSLLETGA